MGQTTTIEWCDSSLNLSMGCDGCELWNPKAGVKVCYAGKITEPKGLDNGIVPLKGWPDRFTTPKLFPERLAPALKWKDLTGTKRPDKPWLNGYPRLIFLDDMGDTFTESLPLDWLAPHVSAMSRSPHIWIILTKRPGRMLQFWRRRLEGLDWFPQNFWLLTSVTSNENVNRIRELLKLRALGAKVLGVSYEPAWGPVDFAPFVTHLDWLIAGGQSGTGAKPSHPDWFRDARDACQASGETAYFFKQWGEWCDTDQLPEATYERFDIHPEDEGRILRYGKKISGALLDGREWREFPNLRGATA